MHSLRALGAIVDLGARLFRRALGRDQQPAGALEVLRASRLQSSVNWRKHRFERGPIVGAEIGDGLEVGFQRPQQPDDLDVAMTFGFQPAPRANAVEIIVDVELEGVARSVAGVLL